MDAFAAIAEPFEARFKTWPMLRDANDEVVLEVAGNGDADFMVTHNPGDFAPARNRGTRRAISMTRRLRHRNRAMNRTSPDR